MAKWNKRHRLLAVWTFRSAVVLVILLGIVLLTREPDEAAVLPGERVEGLTSVLDQPESTGDSSIRLIDVRSASGIDFHHFPDIRGSVLPEDMGSGVACADFDNDGLVDLFFANFAGSILKDMPTSDEARCRLYRNLGDFKFEDVTDRAGVGLIAYAMGAAWGDYDGDGDRDLYITTFGENVLYENRGDGTFRDVTAEAGIQDTRYSAGCAWSDYDRDGDMDLYVSNYVAFEFRAADRGAIAKQYGTEQPYTLNPSAYRPQPNALFRNNGDGTFEDVAAAVGVDDPEGRSLSVSWVDMNNDGLPDLYIANDVSENGVFLNKGDGTFEDVGPSSLAADYRGAMGIAIADFDQDMDQDLLITHWIAQENALYRNMVIDEMTDGSDAGRVWFLDTADAYGLGQISLDAVGWATSFTDFDNDGHQELWIVNGSTFEQPKARRLLKPQRPFFFGRGDGEDFVNMAETTYESFLKPLVGRGGASADFDEDGRVDMVWVIHGGQPLVLKNTSDPVGHWLRVRLKQNKGNRFAIGARVYVTIAGRTLMQEVGCGSSYLSQHELTMHFGLGESTQADAVRIVWPDGTTVTHENVSADHTAEFVP